MVDRYQQIFGTVLRAFSVVMLLGPSLGFGASFLTASPGHNGRLQASAQISGTAARLTSPNGSYWLTVQADGNLVLYRGDCASRPSAACAVWSSRTFGATGEYYLAIQDDGNLVLYRGRVAQDAPSSADLSANAFWSTRTVRNRGSYFLSVEDDGNVVVWEGQGPTDRRNVVWSVKPVAVTTTAAEGRQRPVQAGNSPSATPINLNGSWQNNLLHIWQEGDQVLITASWKRGSLWVIWRAEGKVTGRAMSLPVRYSSMTDTTPGNFRGEFEISNDDNVIKARYTLGGRVVDQQVYHRDR
jgi:hypothetical protein